MKYLKLFESFDEDLFLKLEELLKDNLDSEFVEKYFNMHFDISFEEIILIYPQIIWVDSDFIDNDLAMDAVIDDKINEYSIDDFEIFDFISFIKKYYKDYEDVLYDYYEDFDEDRLDELSESELKDLIINVFGEYAFITEQVKNIYLSYSFKEYIDEEYGIDNVTFEDWNNYKWILDFINDENDIIDYYIETEYDTYESKFYFVLYSFENSTQLQELLLEKNKKSVLIMFDIFKNGHNKYNISDTYDFQKTYIEEFSKNYSDNNEMNEGIHDALKNLNNYFDINNRIEEEYKDYIEV